VGASAVLAVALQPPSPRDWITGYLAVERTGTAAHAAFLDPDVVVDTRPLGGGLVEGRFQTIQVERPWQRMLGAVQTTAVYVDDRGAALVQTMESARVPGLATPRALPVLTVVDVAADGVESVTTLPGTAVADADASSAGPFTVWAGDWVGHAESIAASYARSHRMRLDRATEHHRLDNPWLPHPAVYVRLARPWSDTFDEVWLAARGGPRGDDRVLVGLRLDATGQISAERPMTLREQAGTGWWDGAPPPPLAERRTAVPCVGGRPVEVVNGSPALVEDVRWALARFAAAPGLGEPDVASVTFDPYDPRCRVNQGMATFTGDATDVLVCHEDGMGCRGAGCDVRTERRLLLLHEIAHAWIQAEVGPETRDRFLLLVGLADWSDGGQASSSDWRRLGVEWAAETLVWGAGGPDGTALRVGARPCDQLVAGYRTLTGRAPDRQCP
jgi:hypothetical protein